MSEIKAKLELLGRSDECPVCLEGFDEVRHLLHQVHKLHQTIPTLWDCLLFEPTAGSSFRFPTCLLVQMCVHVLSRRAVMPTWCSAAATRCARSAGPSGHASTHSGPSAPSAGMKVFIPLPSLPYTERLFCREVLPQAQPTRQSSHCACAAVLYDSEFLRAITVFHERSRSASHHVPQPPPAPVDPPRDL